MKFKKDDEGKLVLDDSGDPIAVDDAGEAIDLSKVVAIGKYQRTESERDTYQEQNATLQADIAKLQESAGSAEELKAKVDELTAKAAAEATEFETKLAAAEREHAIETALLAAGCRDTKAARTHIAAEAVTVADGKISGLDLDALQKERPYLFTPSATASTGAKPNGPAKASAEQENEKFINLVKGI